MSARSGDRVGAAGDPKRRPPPPPPHAPPPPSLTRPPSPEGEGEDSGLAEQRRPEHGRSADRAADHRDHRPGGEGQPGAGALLAALSAGLDAAQDDERLGPEDLRARDVVLGHDAPPR